jgi:phenylacetate-CoA ligase
MEAAYLAEVIDPASGQAAPPAAVGELVLTTLGRTGSPLLRYRTGDLVKPAPGAVCACGRSELALEGGILGRTDDMVAVRGVNVYPSAIEEIIRHCGGVAEYQVRLGTARAMAELSLQIEPAPDCLDAPGLARKLEGALFSALGLRVAVAVAPAGSLHRFEMKATRWVRN